MDSAYPSLQMGFVQNTDLREVGQEAIVQADW